MFNFILYIYVYIYIYVFVYIYLYSCIYIYSHLFDFNRNSAVEWTTICAGPWAGRICVDAAACLRRETGQGTRRGQRAQRKQKRRLPRLRLLGRIPYSSAIANEALNH